MKKPILFLIFNRPDTTKKVFESIREYQPKQLFIAADGPRDNKPGEKELCKETRDLVSNIDWDCEVKTLFRDENLGCKDAVSSAITWFFEHIEDGIILEDDCLANQSFFEFCSELLDKYRENKKIMHIGGNNFQFGKTNIPDDYYFSRISHVWGWATWKDRWKLFDKEMKNLNNFIENNKIELFFDTKEFQNYWINAFTNVKKGELNSWAYIWSFVILDNDGLAIIPSNNLVQNIGFSGNATHTQKKPKYIDDFNQDAINNSNFQITKHPKKITENPELDLKYFRKITIGFFKKFLIKLFKKLKLIKIVKKIYFFIYKN